MARYFRMLKHRYFTDDGRTVIRSQRVYVKNSNVTVQLSPITPLLLDLVVNNNLKVEKLPETNRRLESFVTNQDNEVGWSNLKMNLPYPPNEPKLELHIKEILAYPGCICGDYYGEKLSK